MFGLLAEVGYTLPRKPSQPTEQAKWEADSLAGILYKYTDITKRSLDLVIRAALKVKRATYVSLEDIGRRAITFKA